MVSFADVRQWKVDRLDAVHAELGKRRDGLVGLQDELDGARNPGAWTGQAAAGAAQEHAKLMDGMRSLVAEVTTVRVAVATAADDISHVERMIRQADSEAQAHGFQIADDGAIKDVHPPRNVPQDRLEEVKQQRLRIRDQLSADVAKILDEAERTDAELAKALTAAAQDKIQPGRGGTLAEAANTKQIQDLVDSAGKPPSDGPKANAAWWKSLSDEQRAALGEHPPAWLGNRDGIPAGVRDTANRDRIDDVRKSLADEKARLEQGGVSGDEQGKIDELDAKIKSVDAVSKTIQQDNRQLLVLDSSGERLKAAVAVGNVDTADHVSVFTPGFTTTVDDSLAGYDSKMANLVGESNSELQRAGKDDTVAAVTWIGYEPPQWSETGDVLGDSVASSKSAEEGGAKLNDFYQGINESRDKDPHLTAIGHSYGSTTTGYALQGGDHGVDDAVLYGSPGAGTDHIEDLHVPKGHAYLLEAKNDPVADLGRFGTDPTHMDGWTDLSTSKSDHGGEVTGHLDYLNQGTTSQHNIASVVSGMPEQAVQGSDEGIGDKITYVPDKVREGADWTGDRIDDVKGLFS